MTALATVAEIEARIDWVLDDGERRLAQAALDDLSVDARHYTGLPIATPEDCPPLVRSLILRATERFLRNPEGASQSRAGDETLMWDNRKDDRGGSAHFTETEIADLRAVNASNGSALGSFGTFGVFAWTNAEAPRDLTVLPDHGDEPFPWIAAEDEVWW